MILFGSTLSAQGILDKINKAVSGDSAAGKVIQGIGTGKSTGSGKLTDGDVVSGLKEALRVGTQNSTRRLGSVDGFFKDAAIKILMPPEAEKVTRTLRSVGMGSLVDKAILSMNRAAEDAASGVGQIFISAITGMTIADGWSILRGGNTAATDYLRRTTTPQLTERMRPVIDSSLKKTDATKYWKDVFSRYNQISAQKVNPDLTAYVTEKAMQGVFHAVAEEEQKIRKDPAARVTGLLQKVFANP